MAKSIKQREPIALREKALTNGRKSLYLDYYVEDGRTHQYEFLKLYLIPERTKADRIQNANTMQAAKAIQAQRLLERANGKAGIKTRNNGAMFLADYIKEYKARKAKAWRNGSSMQSLNATLKLLEAYKSTKIAVSQIDKQYCLGFLNRIASTSLAEGTKRQYWLIFNTMLNALVRDEIIALNPASKLRAEDKKVIAGTTEARAFLDISEVKRLAQAHCGNAMVKRAFMFACFSGLRISDIFKLTWADVRQGESSMYINIIIQKTQKCLYLPINNNAMQWLPERNGAKDNAPIFTLPQNGTINYHIKRWAKNAGITKDVCFHVSRHTFATSLLTMGADLYTTSKLLGHSNVRTTQIYAEVVNQKKNEAVNMLDNIQL